MLSVVEENKWKKGKCFNLFNILWATHHNSGKKKSASQHVSTRDLLDSPAIQMDINFNTAIQWPTIWVLQLLMDECSHNLYADGYSIIRSWSLSWAWVYMELYSVPTQLSHQDQFLWYKLPSRIQPWHSGSWRPRAGSSNLPADILAWIQNPFHSHAPLKRLLAFNDLKKKPNRSHQTSPS